MKSTHTRHTAVVLVITSLIGLTSACSAPGSGGPTTTAPTPPASTAPTPASSTTVPQTPGCGTAPVTMKAYIETGFPMPQALFDEFSKQYPNVTWDVRQDQFAVITQNAPRVLQDDPPDIMRLPQLSGLADQGLLYDLDTYATAFGWDQWPASQLEQLRLDSGGARGTGPLWGMGLNFSMTGVFYNKTLAAKIGFTQAPKTLAEFDGLLAAAKAAGITPIVQFNGGATGGLNFPLQNLMASYGPVGPINDWVFLKPGATINTPTNVQAAEHLEQWIKDGYFASDINSLDYSMMMSRFIAGDALFMFNGDWASGDLDSQMTGNVGFILFPPAQAGGKYGAMSAPLTYGISAKAAHPDCAAFFFNWVATNDAARTVAVQKGGSHPMGLPDAYMPAIDPNSVTAQTLAAGAQIAADNGGMDFIANATGAIYAQSETPNLQKLVGGQQTGAGLIAAVQADYEAELANR